MVQEFGGKVQFVSENYGDSALAKRFGVTRYPAIFVDDVLVATPNDFGFYGPGEKEQGGRYAPLKSAEAHQRFRADLRRMIDLLLAGDKDAARAQASPRSATTISTLPVLDVIDLDGKKLRREDLAGKVVLVEMWATWHTSRPAGGPSSPPPSRRTCCRGISLRSSRRSRGPRSRRPP